jgi:serine/threonine protein phosphatase PrpC
MTKITSYFHSDIGQKRTNNEDAVGAFEPRDDHQLRRSGRLYVVADGMGGHQMGEKASAYAVEAILQAYYEAPEVPPGKRLRDIIQQINEYLITFARQNFISGEKLGTTIVVAVVRNGTLQIAHVGDSRAYLIRNGEVQQLTRDHSFVNELIRAKAITEEEAQQSPYRNRLLRSVGGSDAQSEVDITEPIPLQTGDMILLCTDGLTQYASTQDILNVTSRSNPRDAVERLIQFANDRGGTDNITACVVKYGSGLVIPTFGAYKPSRKTLVSIGAGFLILVLLLVLGINFTGRYVIGKVALTSTLLPTETTIPKQTATSTPTIATPTLRPTDVIVTSPTVEGLVDCKYTVRDGDFAGGIVESFGTDLQHLFYEDGSQDDFYTIYPESILILDDISVEACINGGGESLVSSTVP